MASKPLCKYGSKCYRKNPDHLRRFAHPSDSSSELEAGEPRKLRGKQRLREREEQGSSATKRPRLADSSDSEVSPEPSVAATEDNAVPASLNEDCVRKGHELRGDLTESAAAASLEEGTTNRRAGEEGESCGEEETSRSFGEGIINEEELERDRACEDVREKVKRKFLVEMPDDFYQFWEFCKSLNPSHPQSALVQSVGLELVGPYHVLAGQLEGVTWERCTLQSRYFYDPPEMVTVVRRVSSSSQYHLGYFRDDPRKGSALIVSNDPSTGCELKLEAQHIFAAIKSQVESALKAAGSASSAEKKSLQTLADQLKSKMRELSLSASDPKTLAKQRNKEIVAKCLHKIGIVVLYDEQTDVGYRSLPMTDRELMKLLNNISSCSEPAKRDQLFEPLQEMITFVQFANDECDYGMGLELGLDLFCHSSHFHSVVSHLLPLAYDLLHREEYGKIVELHLSHRQHSPHDFSHII